MTKPHEYDAHFQVTAFFKKCSFFRVAEHGKGGVVIFKGDRIIFVGTGKRSRLAMDDEEKTCPVTKSGIYNITQYDGVGKGDTGIVFIENKEFHLEITDE